MLSTTWPEIGKLIWNDFITFIEVIFAYLYISLSNSFYFRGNVGLSEHEKKKADFI